MKCKIEKLENQQHCWKQYCETHERVFYTLLDNPEDCDINARGNIK